ncbi:hypothetical protein [Catellatospora vulcania]|uniref:hypothetical protein n=1 Tax=Catellatospora vulcania TaxID=1460450 RepID=UPI0012D487B9|nr:hypothetical protein [Catellatospora vulcania]
MSDSYIRLIPSDRDWQPGWPVGFARFEVSAMNPTRAKYELDAAELAEVAGLLGHPVKQILAHY